MSRSKRLWAVCRIYGCGILKQILSDGAEDHSGDDDVRVVHRAGAEETRGKGGVAEEGAHDPPHLNSHECKDCQPGELHPPVGRAARDEGAVRTAQIELAADAGDGEHEGIEQDGVGVAESAGVPEHRQRREGGQDQPVIIPGNGGDVIPLAR